MRFGFAALLVVCLGFSAAAFAAEEKKMGDSDPAIAAIDAQIAKAKVDKMQRDWKSHVPKPEKVTFDPKHTYFWVLDTTKGQMEIKLFPKVAPMHVTSTIYLTKLGFYDGVVFHRVIQGFMAQGGDPTGTGSGGPGYKYDGEFAPDGPKHDKAGILSMAHAGPGTDGSQFFITFGPTPHLNNVHTVFGEVVKGMDTLKKLEASGSQSGRTSEKLEIVKATIRVE
jgi:peptidyl-prolyl cis-trans isomerase B (cyclophilin B)